ncbi:MAG TPA: pyruvate formate lyase family protein, partial [Clostridiales bacterium]|nr:pyruvate formate lyase family protein [Clostridiales bacterium]
MKDLKLLQDEIGKSVCSYLDCTASLLYPGYAQNPDAPAALARGYAVASLFTNCPIHIYENDKILGSIRGKFENSLGLTEESLKYRRELIENFGERSFLMNFDHFAPDYETFLKDGIAATLEKIRKSRFDFSNSPDSENEILFLDSLEIAMTGFQNMVRNYAQEAFSRAQGEKEPIRKVELEKMALVADSLTKRAPQSFREALQLMWFVHVAFVLEGRNAMAIGRMDQFLFPYYEADRIKGEISEDEALELLAFTLCKIGESRIKGGDDVVNIAIGGVRRDGSDAVNELSFLILEAVKICNIPGPNLSARISKETPDEFLDACLCVIGTGLGYPALMNDEVNIPALFRHGYSLEDCRDYCMVGCIENFLAGKQPPWSDGRYNTPKFLELALNNGICMLTGVQMGPKTGEPESFNSMEEFLKAFEEQMEYGAADYMMRFRNENDRLNRFSYSSPFLSCFCSSCIERGLDINNGGTIYPSVHGAGCMGIATVADSLAAIEKTVFVDKKISLGQLRKVLLADFEGYESVRILLKKAPKYGNNEDLVDRYAVWYVNIHDKIFSKYKTPDGGP